MSNHGELSKRNAVLKQRNGYDHAGSLAQAIWKEQLSRGPGVLAIFVTKLSLRQIA